MEKFDIDKEMAKLKGLNIIEKCSALDDLLDDLEDAQEQIICAKDEISEEYANVFTKKFHEEIASFIAETFDGKIPYVEKYGYQIMYDNRPIYITLFCTYGEWSICLFVKSQDEVWQLRILYHVFIIDNNIPTFILEIVRYP